MSPEQAPEEPGPEPFEEDLYVLTNEDARENPAPDPLASDPLASEDIIIIEDDPPAAPAAPVLPRRRSRWPLAAAAAALVAALGIALWTGSQPSGTAPAAPAIAAVAPAPRPAPQPAPLPAPAAAARPESKAPLTEARPAKTEPATTVVAPARVPVPTPAPAGPVLRPGAECAVLLANGRFFEAVWKGRAPQGDRFEVPDGHVIVTADERPRIFVRGTPEFALLHGEREGWLVTKSGHRYTGSIYVLDETRVVIGTSEDRVEFPRSDVREVRVTREAGEGELMASLR